MPWAISHANHHGGAIVHTATSMRDLSQQVAHVLPAGDWRVVAYLFKQRNKFMIPAREAGKAARILGKAASHHLMPPSVGGDVALLADAAGRAASAGEPWEWN